VEDDEKRNRKSEWLSPLDIKHLKYGISKENVND
jgi:hypothetical protein